MFYSPLRYPGGKNKLAPFIAKVCFENKINGCYIEPYSGGASVALFMLFEGFFDQIVINDKDRSIYAFWYSAVFNSKKLCDLIDKTKFTIEEWRKQKEIQNNKETEDLLILGYSTFYLNRTNRSGILNAGVIGGVNQNGNYLMDCRFNKVDLIEKIRNIGSKKKFITVKNYDAIDLISEYEKSSVINRENSFFYFDPPYYNKADTLYLNHYGHDDHLRLSKEIKTIKNINWIVSYDNTKEIKVMYDSFFAKEYSFNHTAYNSRVGLEIIIFKPNLNINDINNFNPVNVKFSNSRFGFK